MYREHILTGYNTSFRLHSEQVDAVCHFSCARICTIVFRTTRSETFNTTWRLDDNIFLLICINIDKIQFLFGCKFVTSMVVQLQVVQVLSDTSFCLRN